MEEEESEDKKRQKKKKTTKQRNQGKKAGSAWLKEEGDEDVVDFLDPSVAKKVLGK